MEYDKKKYFSLIRKKIEVTAKFIFERLIRTLWGVV